MSFDDELRQKIAATLRALKEEEDPSARRDLKRQLYTFADDLFPECARLKRAYRSKSGSERDALKKEYIERFHALWTALAKADSDGPGVSHGGSGFEPSVVQESLPDSNTGYVPCEQPQPTAPPPHPSLGRGFEKMTPQPQEVILTTKGFDRN